LVVRFSGGDDAANATMEEDLKIMAHVIERSLHDAVGDDVKSGIRLLYADGGQSVRGMYLDGFGALFTAKVGFPVFATIAPEKRPPPPAADSEWDRAKREVNGESEGRALDVGWMGGGAQFDPEQVEELKKALLQSLKNASNLHHLKPNDFIAITVFGQPSVAVQARRVRGRTQSANLFQDSLQDTPATPAPGAAAVRRADVANRVRTSSSQGTVLALRVRKSDVDAFATGKLDWDAFAAKAEQNSYPGSSSGSSGFNSTSWSVQPPMAPVRER
jgi:hypothetical protein